MLAVLLALRRRLRTRFWLVRLSRRRRWRRVLVIHLTPLRRRLGLVSRHGVRPVGCRFSQSRRRSVVVILQGKSALAMLTLQQS